MVECQVTVSGRYRFNITNPSTPAATDGSSPNVMQYFQFTATSYLTASGGPSNSSAVITTLIKATETFRDRVSKLIYVASSQSLKYTLYPASETATDTVDLSANNIHLYPVGSIADSNSVYDISAGSEILTDSLKATRNYTTASKTLTYTTTPLSPGYYVFVATYSTTNINFIRITFQSDKYACPYNPAFPDYYSNFQPCSTSVINNQQPGFPCLNYDAINRVCVGCVVGYNLANGTCVVNTVCG